LLGGNRRIAATFHGWKLFDFVHARLIPGSRVLQPDFSRRGRQHHERDSGLVLESLPV
jgi:hypothetical protein